MPTVDIPTEPKVEHLLNKEIKSMRYKNLTITITLRCLSILVLAGLVMLPISDGISCTDDDRRYQTLRNRSAKLRTYHKYSEDAYMGWLVLANLNVSENRDGFPVSSASVSLSMVDAVLLRKLYETDRKVTRTSKSYYGNATIEAAVFPWHFKNGEMDNAIDTPNPSTTLIAASRKQIKNRAYVTLVKEKDGSVHEGWFDFTTSGNMMGLIKLERTTGYKYIDRYRDEWTATVHYTETVEVYDSLIGTPTQLQMNKDGKMVRFYDSGQRTGKEVSFIGTSKEGKALASISGFDINGCDFASQRVEKQIRSPNYNNTVTLVHTKRRLDGSMDEKRHSGETEKSLRKKYRHLQAKPEKWFDKLKKKRTHTWEEWIDTNAELSINAFISSHWNDGNPYPWFLEAYNTRAEVAAAKAAHREFYELIANRWQNKGRRVPPTASGPKAVLAALYKTAKIETKEGQEKIRTYDGPQTSEAILAAYDDSYTLFPSERRDRMDAAYPKETWIQDFLNRGAEFTHFGDYEKYLDSRQVFMNRSNDPSVWSSGQYGIRPCSTLEAYKDAFIKREIWIQETWNRVLEEHPDVTGMAIEGNNYLPFKAGLTYVRRNGPFTTTWGTMLSAEEKEDLIMHGIHPKGIEIVYIDNDYKVLSEKPHPWDPKSPDAKAVTEKVLKEMMPELRPIPAETTDTDSKN